MTATPSTQPAAGTAVTAPATAPLLVAFDGSGPARLAASWAAREAAATGRPLRIVHVLHTPDPGLADRGLPARAVDAALVRRTAEAGLATAVSRAQQQAPGLEVSGELRTGDAVEVLGELAAPGSTLVLGACGQTGCDRVLLGSSAAELLRDAIRSTVVVVRTPPGGHPRSVVVGIDGSAASGAALRFAFAHAARLRLPVVAVHAWSDLPLAALAGSADLDPDELRERAAATLAAAVADVHHEYPGLPVSTVAVPDRPVAALLDRAADAELLVLGRHGRAGSARPLGSIAHAVAHYAPCSVAVVGAA